MENLFFKMVMSEKEAEEIASKKGNPIWKIIFYSMPLSKLELRYIEYKLIDVEVTGKVSVIKRLISGAESEEIIRKNILAIGNGTSGGVAIVTDLPETEEREFSPDDQIQYSNFSNDVLEKNAKKLAHRVVHRIIGGIPEAKVISCKSIFRPFWIAYYGKYEAGHKVRYITIPADNGSIRRRR